LGDNRQDSLDSRYFGPLDRKNIIGRAWLKVWPFKEFGHFTQPVYSDIN
jgi:signal peptidase I